MITKASARQRGFTLIEMLAVLAALTFVLGVCAALITMLLRLSDSSERHTALETSIARASRAFRADVRSADAVELRSKGRDLAYAAWLIGDGTTVEYFVGADSLYRTETIGDMVIGYEQFHLPEKSFPRFERVENDGQVFVVLTFDRRGGRSTSKAAIRLFRVEAALGQSQRFSGGKS